MSRTSVLTTKSWFQRRDRWAGPVYSPQKVGFKEETDEQDQCTHHKKSFAKKWTMSRTGVLTKKSRLERRDRWAGPVYSPQKVGCKEEKDEQDQCTHHKKSFAKKWTMSRTGVLTTKSRFQRREGWAGPVYSPQKVSCKEEKDEQDQCTHHKKSVAKKRRMSRISVLTTKSRLQRREGWAGPVYSPQKVSCKEEKDEQDQCTHHKKSVAKKRRMSRTSVLTTKSQLQRREGWAGPVYSPQKVGCKEEKDEQDQCTHHKKSVAKKRRMSRTSVLTTKSQLQRREGWAGPVYSPQKVSYKEEKDEQDQCTHHKKSVAKKRRMSRTSVLTTKSQLQRREGWAGPVYSPQKVGCKEEKDEQDQCTHHKKSVAKKRRMSRTSVMIASKWTSSRRLFFDALTVALAASAVVAFSPVLFVRSFISGNFVF